MATQAFDSAGGELRRGDSGSPEVFTKIAEINSITLNPTREFQDATSLDSTGGYREVIPSFRDGGEVPLNMNFVPTDAQQSPTTGIISDFDTDLPRNYKIVFPDVSTTTISFSAYVSGYSPGLTVGEIVKQDVTLKITGAPVWS